MPTVLMYPAKCIECGASMRAGTEAAWIKDTDGGYSYAHVGDCPELKDKPARQANARPCIDVETLYTMRKCGGCGQATAWHRGRHVPSCPYCPGEWLDGYGFWEAA